MEHRIENCRLQATVSENGGELISLLHLNKERLWQNENGSWAGHAPLLFPACGHFNVVHKGKAYDLPAHGYAKKSTFSVTEKGKDFIRLRLEKTDWIKSVYPFDLDFSVLYRLSGDKLFIEYEIKNVGDEGAYFACGGHESFALDENLQDYGLIFQQDEQFLHLPHDDGGYLTGESVLLGKGTYLPLPTQLLQGGNTVIFGGIKSGNVRLVKGDRPVADISFDGFENLLLWRPEGAKMLCIEPWTNLPDKRGDLQEISQKQGVIRLEKGETKTLVRCIEYFE